MDKEIGNNLLHGFLVLIINKFGHDYSSIKLTVDFIKSCTGRVYNVYDISEFARAGQRAHTSPAEEVIMDLITLGVTVDSLYRILHTMDARQCMETLAEFGEYFHLTLSTQPMPR